MLGTARRVAAVPTKSLHRPDALLSVQCVGKTKKGRSAKEKNQMQIFENAGNGCI